MSAPTLRSALRPGPADTDSPSFRPHTPRGLLSLFGAKSLPKLRLSAATDTTTSTTASATGASSTTSAHLKALDSILGSFAPKHHAQLEIHRSMGDKKSNGAAELAPDQGQSLF